MSAAPAPNNKAGGTVPRTASGAVGLDLGQLAALGLTPRECEVMVWICEGKRDREIGVILGLSPRTVQKHVCNIFEKLRVETRTAAASQCRYTLASATTTQRRNDASIRVATRGDPPPKQPPDRMVRNGRR